VLLKPSGRLREGEQLTCVGTDVRLTLQTRGDRGHWTVTPTPATGWLALLGQVGRTPLPPYIRRVADDTRAPVDIERYQTVYAERPGAVAAPTAGLHFTDALLEQLAADGVSVARVTLHVGAGTFTPIAVDALADHPMHAEWFEVTAATLRQLAGVRPAGGRIVAVGTTSARVLESLPTLDAGAEQDQRTWTDIFIYPPYEFRHVDRLITNFHLPGSTLLAMVMALASPAQIRTAYAAAIAQNYRFYSYGDAMLIR
jgi:S-adenosylmethionine:tRNA ribosyltransferase-isomerase